MFKKGQKVWLITMPKIGRYDVEPGKIKLVDESGKTVLVTRTGADAEGAIVVDRGVEDVFLSERTALAQCMRRTSQLQFDLSIHMGKISERFRALE